MEDWEFLIQREGDRKWRSIKTGNLQLTEGKYRIVANSNLLNTSIQTRLTHQTLGSTVPQRRSQSCNQTTNSKGLLAIIPFTQLHPGIWQFVCSSTTAQQGAWHQIVKLRVIPRTPTLDPDPILIPTAAELDLLDLDAAGLQPTLAHSESDLDSTRRTFVKSTQTQLPTISAPQLTIEEEAEQEEEEEQEQEDRGAPTEAISSISMQGEQESWAEGLDQLLEQLEQDSLQGQTRQPAIRETLPGVIQLHEIVETPSQLIILNRSTFSGMIPGTHLTILGTCNLQRLSTNLIQTVKVEKLSICLRHPQTAEIIASIERSLPPNFETFSFSGQLELLTEPKISLLLGEVNLYDKHHIQLGSSGFTVTLNLNPPPESELSLLQLFDRHLDNTDATLNRLTQELELEAATIGASSSSAHADRSTVGSTTIPPIDPNDDRSHPASSLTDKQESSIDRHPDIHPVNLVSSDPTPSPDVAEVRTDRSTPPLPPQHPNPTHPLPLDTTDDDLEIDFARATLVGGGSPLEHRHSEARNYPNLEIVVDD